MYWPRKYAPLKRCVFDSTLQKVLILVQIAATAAACNNSLNIGSAEKIERSCRAAGHTEDAAEICSVNELVWVESLEDFSVLEDNPISGKSVRADAGEGLSVRYSFAQGAMDCDDGTWVNLSLDETSGALGGTPINSDVGTCTLAIRATSREDVIEQTITITVVEVNDPPTWDETIPDFSTEVNGPINLTALASDVDVGETPSYSLDLAGMTCDNGTWSPNISINASTGEITGTPRTGDANANCTVKVLAQSGSDTISQTFVISLTPSSNAVSVYHGAQSTASTVWQTLIWENETYDTNNLHSTSLNTDRLTAAVPGYYYASTSIRFDINDTGSRLCAISASNGSKGTWSRKQATNNTGIKCEAIFYLSAGDYLYASAYQASGSAINVFGQLFQMYRLPDSDSVKVYRGSNVNIPSAAWTNIDWDIEEYDTNDLHSVDTNPSRLTAKSQGYYLVVGTLQFLMQTGGARLAAIKVNGDFSGINLEQTAPDGHSEVSVSNIVRLNAGDYVELAAYQDYGSSLAVDSVNVLHLAMHKLPDDQQAKVTKAVAQPVNQLVGTVLTWDTEQYDSNDLFDSAASDAEFLVKESGYYYIGVHETIDYNGSTGHRGLFFWHSGAGTADWVLGNTYWGSYMNLSTVYYLEANDVIHAMYYLGGPGGSISTGGMGSFTIHKLGK